MHPEFITIGPLTISSYGVMNALAYAACILYLLKYKSRVGMTKENLWDIVFIVVVGAVLGGKLWYLLVERPYYGGTLFTWLKNAVLNFRYGFAFFGGFLVSVSALLVFLKRKKLPVFKTADYLIPALPLGHFLGRIGCFLVGCCHGREWHGPLAVTFNDPHSLVAPALLGVPVYPVQLWESGANLIIFFILHFAYNKHKHNGSILCMYGVLYGAARFCLEFFRGDWRGGFFMGISPSQLVGLGVCAAAVIYYFTFVRRGVNDK